MALHGLQCIEMISFGEQVFPIEKSAVVSIIYLGMGSLYLRTGFMGHVVGCQGLLLPLSRVRLSGPIA